MNKQPARLALLLVIALLVAVFFALDLGRLLELSSLQARRDELLAWRDARPLAAALLFFAAYVAMAALSLPGATLMTLLAGAIFGLGWGTLIVSFASSLGATLAFLSARWLFGDWVRRRFAGPRLQALDAGLARDGGLYLFGLRLVPALPFFLVNLALGLSTMRAATFYWVSQVGMLPATLLYVNAGTRLASLQSVAGLVSPAMLASLALLGLFPLLARRLVERLRGRRHAPARWQRPRRFDCNVLVIGAGSAGLVTAYLAAALKARVTLVEQAAMGGDCLNTGCVPSKALIRAARAAHELRGAHRFGIENGAAPVEPAVDFAAVMARVQQVIAQIAPHDSVERYRGLGVEVLQGTARIVSPWQVEIRRADGSVEQRSSRAIVVATGAKAALPALPGIELIEPLHSDNVWQLRRLPQRLLVLGGGPIGCELAQAFARLGARVTLLQRGPRLLPREDEDVSRLVRERFDAEGITVLTGWEARRIERSGEARRLIAASATSAAEGTEQRLDFDELLFAVGRRARLQGYGLEALGLATDGPALEVDGFMRTAIPSIYAAGDVAGPFQFTHMAAHQAWYAAINALFDPLKTFRADYSIVPWATFIEPEVARVGLNEQQAREQGIAYELSRYDLDGLDRAIADGAADGFIKVLTAPGKDRILGVTIVGPQAAELLAEYVLAMKHGIGLNKILSTIHVYPTLAEANKQVAGVWRRAHAPAWALRIAARFHRWRLG